MATTPPFESQNNHVDSNVTGSISDGESRAPGGSVGGPALPAPKKRSRMKLLVLAGLGLLVFAAASIGGAEYYTSRPNFCGSCHVMDPYFDSWSHDIHGKKAGVLCVECHYAPGEQHTIHAKFRGLSQAASYFSGRYGAGRPRAHVNNGSCLTSECHGDGNGTRLADEHMNKSLLIGVPRTETRLIAGLPTEVERKPTVRFMHAKHQLIDERVTLNQRDLAVVTDRLRRSLPPDHFSKIEAAVRSVKDAALRQADLTALLRQLGHDALSADAAELMRLEHMRIRLAQLADLNCAACHTYDAGGSNHFRVDTTTCFTCHFTHQEFNRDTGECLKCHEPPTRQIVVHAPVAGTSTTSAAGALMDHQDIVARGIDCASCHADVIQGQATVSARDCTHCHDQQKFIEEFEARTTHTVEEYHRVHVGGQHARCTDCHRVIHHALIEPEFVGSRAEFLKPVVDDCQHCHPSHHREQVELLMGVGGAGIDRPMPNAMFGSRMNCRACHSESGNDFKGDPLVKATEDTCLKCHGDDYRTVFQQWRGEIASQLAEARAALQRVDDRIKAIGVRAQSLPPRVRDGIENARTNIRLIETGNGVHNRTYAVSLLDLAARDLDAALAELSRL